VTQDSAFEAVKTSKLLLAVESATIRRVLELTFAGGDIDVVAVADGEQAIARIPVERPDVVLADIALPQRSGYDIAAFVKNDPALSHIRVLLLAGAFEAVDDAKAAEVKSDGVLAKPFEPQHVLTRVQELLGLEPAAVANAAIPRAVERLIPPRPLEFPRRGDTPIGGVQTARLAGPPPAKTADPPATGLSVDRELDEYFEQLDAAFDSLGTDPTASARLGDPLPSLDDDDNRPVPTVDRLISGDDGTIGNVPVPRSDAARGTFDLLSAGDPPSAAARPTTAGPSLAGPGRASPAHTAHAGPAHVGPAPLGEPHKPGTIADAFAALLAFEEGDRSVTPVRLVPQPQAPAIGEDLVEEVTRRVLARLAPGAVKDLVAEVVSEVAERLVREEIQRIRNSS
jgi:CheY-like chemotaxis protein